MSNYKLQPLTYTTRDAAKELKIGKRYLQAITKNYYPRIKKILVNGRYSYKFQYTDVNEIKVFLNYRREYWRLKLRQNHFKKLNKYSPVSIGTQITTIEQSNNGQSILRRFIKFIKK